MSLMNIPVIETETLRLRAPEMRDFEAYAAFRASPRTVLLGGPYTYEQAFDQFCTVIGQWQLRGYGRWLVADRATDEALGIIGIFHPMDWPEPELAWSVFEQAEGRGVAFEAAQAARRFAYDTLGLTTLISLIVAENTRSLALARRLGAQYEADFEHPEYGTMPIWRHPAPADLSGA